MPVRPLCHGAWCFWPGSQGLSRSRGMRFLVKFGHLAEIERLDPAEPDHPRRHPVGHHDHVALDRLAGRQLVLHLGVELGVVVDVVGVGHRDAGLLLEDRHRGPRLVDRVDVGRPVRDDQPLVGRRHVRREARGRVLLGAVDARRRGASVPRDWRRRTRPHPPLERPYDARLLRVRLPSMLPLLPNWFGSCHARGRATRDSVQQMPAYDEIQWSPVLDRWSGACQHRQP